MATERHQLTRTFGYKGRLTKIEDVDLPSSTYRQASHSVLQNAVAAATEDLDFTVVHRIDDHAEQRGLEQLPYKDDPQAQAANGGLDKMRPISPGNKNRDAYMDAVHRHLVQQGE